MTAESNSPRALLAAARGLGIVPRRAVPAWRPAPSTRRNVPATGRRVGEPAKVVRSIWIAPERESLGEKLLMGLLGVAAVVGIGYGFASLVDLVQHWAMFANGIGQMIQ